MSAVVPQLAGTAEVRSSQQAQATTSSLTLTLSQTPGYYDTIVIGSACAGAGVITAISGCGAQWSGFSFATTPTGCVWFGAHPAGPGTTNPNQVTITFNVAVQGDVVAAIVHGLQVPDTLAPLLTPVGQSAIANPIMTPVITYSGPTALIAAAPVFGATFSPTTWSNGGATTTLRPDPLGAGQNRDLAIDLLVVNGSGSVSATLNASAQFSGVAIIALPVDTTQVPDPSLPLTYPRAVQSTPFLRHYWRLGGTASPYQDIAGGVPLTLTGTALGSGPGLIAADDDGAIVRASGQGNLAATIPAIGNAWSWTGLANPQSTNSGIAYMFQLPSVTLSSGSTNRTYFLFNQSNLLACNTARDTGSGAGTAVYVTWAGNPIIGTIVHITGTWDGQFLRLYANGALVATSPDLTGQPMENLPSGALAGLQSSSFGTFDEFALFSEALSADQVTRLYQAVSQVDVPAAPQNVTATASINAASVSWTAPAWNGGSPITGYTISWPGGTQTAAATATGAAVNGLTAGASYTFSVAAVNAAGTGTVVQSNAVTPTAPVWTGPLTYPKAVQSTAFLRCYWRLGGPSPWVDVLGGPSMTTQPTGTADPAPVAGLIAASDDGGLQISASRPQATLASLPIQRWSLSVLFKAPTASGNTFVMQVAPTAGGWIQVAVQSTGQLLVNSQAAFGVTITLPGSYADGNPHLCVLTWDGSIVGLYGDLGNAAAVPAASAPGWAPGAWSVGANTSNGGLLVGGVVDEAALFSEALTADQIARLYQAVTQADLPQVPQNVSAHASFNAASVSWTAPAWDGGSAVTGYTITWPGGSRSVAASPTNAVISGLTAGTSYAFSVAAVNAVGAGPAAQTAAVVPTAPPDYGTLPLTYPRAVRSTPFLEHYWRLGGAGPWVDEIAGKDFPVSTYGQPVPGLIAADDDGAVLLSGTIRSAALDPIGTQWSRVSLLSTTGASNQGVLSGLGLGALYMNVGTDRAPTNQSIGVYAPWSGAGWVTWSGGPFNTGAAYHIVETYDGTTLRLYGNGVQRVSLSGGVSNLSGGQLVMGVGALPTIFDEIAIFSVALTPEQVQRLYQAVSQPDLPDTPPNALVTAGPASAMLRWDASWDGGSPMRYVVTWTPNGTPE